MIRKAHLVVIALLFLGQNLFAGGKWNHYQTNALNQGAKLATSLAMLFVAQQLSGSGDSDGDNEGTEKAAEYTRSRMEAHRRGDYIEGPGNYWAPLATTSHTEESDEDEEMPALEQEACTTLDETHASEEIEEKAEELDALYVLEREAARCIDGAFPNLPPEERAILIARTCEPIQEALDRRHRMAQRIHEIIQRAASGLCHINRGVAAREISELLASPEITLTDAQRDMLLYKLIGEHGDQGLASDEHWSVRWCAAEAIGCVLASGNLDADVRAILLTRLVGDNTQTGLINDQDEDVREEAIKATGTILAAEYISEDERPRLLNMLVGEKEHEGLASNRNQKMRRGVVQAIGKILASKQPVEVERIKLIHALKKLASDGAKEVRWHVAQTIGKIFVSETPTEDERSKLIGMLIGEDNQDGLAADEDASVRWTVAEASGRIPASSSRSNNERWKIRRALTVLAGDPDNYVREAARRAMGSIP